MKKSILLTLFGLAFAIACRDTQDIPVPTKDWWQTAQFYQIYPRSFKDSNGDGIGDLNGIKSKLEHLKDIGVTATWLSPIFKSPMADFGYDISDFYDIQDEYGTLDDFAKLIEKANTLGIKIILDFVPNHSSNESEWFKKSVNREKGYEDFYVWHDGYKFSNGSRQPPSNWLQAFRGSAWEWNEHRQQYYLHQYVVQQPDLNYRNPAVVEKMKSVLKYWLDKGVDGFRVDAVPCIFEALPDENGKYIDEPLSNLTDDPDDAKYLKHIYTRDQPETVDMVYQWRKLLDDYQRIHGGDTRVLLIETYSKPDYSMKMYGNATTKGAHVPFNFNFIIHGNANSNAVEIVEIIDLWLKNMPYGQTPNWVMGNHDRSRVGSRYGSEKIDTMNMILMMLPGVSVTYNGEEIGMTDANISWEDSRDPAACNSNSSIYEKFTRDPVRTPFQWDSSVAAGFSTNSTTWLPINPNYVTVNLQAENEAVVSHLKVYKDLVNLRKNRLLQFGDNSYYAYNDDVLVIERYMTDAKSMVLVANMQGNQQDNIDLSKNSARLPESLEYKIVSVSSTHKIGETVKRSAISLAPYEAVILG